MSELNSDQLASGEEAGPLGPERSVQGTSTLGTLARLAVGAALLGRDAIGSAMASIRDPSNETAQPTSGDHAPNSDSLFTVTDVPCPKPSPRHLLIGALFDTGERIERQGVSALQLIGKATSPVVRWVRRSQLTAPARRRFDTLSARGEAQVQRWVERGMLEEQRSRALLNTTVTTAANRSLDNVVESPQVQGLVQEFVEAQGQSLGRRFLEELRALSVSGDLAVARLACRVVRHPKPEVPPLPRAVPEPAVASAPPADLRGRGAGFVSRLMAFMIDVILISVAIRATGWLLEDIRIATGWSLYLPAVSSGGYMTPIYVTAGGGLLMSALYFLFFWSVAGMTPGKGLIGLRIVRRDGSSLSLMRSIFRLLGYLVSTLLYGLGYLWIAIDNRREAWHDKIAKTAVIYAWDARPSTRSPGSVIRPVEHPEENLPQED